MFAVWLGSAQTFRDIPIYLGHRHFYSSRKMFHFALLAKFDGGNLFYDKYHYEMIKKTSVFIYQLFI